MYDFFLVDRYHTHPLKHFVHLFLLFFRRQVDQVRKPDIPAGRKELVSNLAGCIWPVVKPGNFVENMVSQNPLSKD